MNKKVKEYMEEIKKELDELGIKIIFKEGYLPQASGGQNVLNNAKVQKASILTAKLEGFEDALRLLNLKGNEQSTSKED